MKIDWIPARSNIHLQAFPYQIKKKNPKPTTQNDVLASLVQVFG